MLTKIQKVEDFALHRKCEVFYWGDCMKRICTAILMVLFAPTLLADESAGAHIFARRDNGTNIVSRLVPDGSDVATVDYVDKVAAGALFALTNDFAANFTPLAAPLVTNLVEDVLSPRTLEFHYGADSSGETVVTNAFVAPMFATSKVEFIRDDPEGDANNDVAYMYSAGKLRNFSVLIDEIQGGYLTMTFAELAATHKIYAQPKLYDSTRSTTETGEPMPYCWDLYTNDVPCVVTIREPEAGTLVLRRDRLDQDEVYIKVEDGEAAVYTDGEPE